jgi:hypothetical protein
MATYDPLTDGKVLYETSARPVQPLLTTAVGLVLGLLFAGPAAWFLFAWVNDGWSIGLLLMSLVFASLSILSIYTCVRLALRRRGVRVTLCNNKLVYDFDRSRDSIDCSEIVGAEKQSEGVAVKTKSGRSLYLPKQFIGSDRDLSDFANCVDNVVRAGAQQAAVGDPRAMERSGFGLTATE